MPDDLGFKDPHKGKRLTFKTVPIAQLEVIGHQRKSRPAHLKNLSASIERIGFLVPLVVVEDTQDGKTRYVIIDGQHRFQAAKELGVNKFPVIVAPKELATRMMNLNIEKDLNIREKSFVALSILRHFLEANPKLSEDDEEVVDSIEHAHYLTLGLAYEKAARLAGSSFEPILKRCDSFLDQPLADAYETRQERAAKVLEANDLVKSISAKIKEMGRWHSFVTQQILSYANPLKRKRGAVEFDEAFDSLIKKLQTLKEAPEKALREPVGE